MVRPGAEKVLPSKRLGCMAELVAVDIGGTHARFALASVAPGGVVALGEAVTCRTADHASFPSAWKAFAAKVGRDLPRACALAVAGPVGGEAIHFTNNFWIIRPADLPETIGVEHITLINDSAAIGHAAATVRDDQFVRLCGPDGPLPGAGTLSVVGPGTGLGVCHVWRDGAGGYRVQSTEGGHVAFAPLDQVEDAILARLRKRYSRVSVERVVSGPAIVDIYEVLTALDGRAVPPLDDRTIWQRGLSGEDRLAVAAMERFCLALGSVAGDLALAQGAGGVVIAGGLGLRIKDRLMASGFGERFRAKGRFESLMAEIPVRIVTHPQPGLLGAAAAFAREHLA